MRFTIQISQNAGPNLRNQRVPAHRTLENPTKKIVVTTIFWKYFFKPETFKGMLKIIAAKRALAHKYHFYLVQTLYESCARPHFFSQHWTNMF